MDKTEAPIVVQGILNYIKKGEPIILGNEDIARLKSVQGKHSKNYDSLKEQK